MKNIKYPDMYNTPIDIEQNKTTGNYSKFGSKADSNPNKTTQKEVKVWLNGALLVESEDYVIIGDQVNLVIKIDKKKDICFIEYPFNPYKYYISGAKRHKKLL